MDRRDTEPQPRETSDQYRQDNQVASMENPENTVTNANVVRLSEENNYLDDNEKTKNKKKLRRNKEKERENIFTSGNILINAFLNLLTDTKASRDVLFHYMERVLHSIFFFGYINWPPITPDEFLPERKAESYKRTFPKPFKEYNTHLPYYTPYSILLEYMTKRLEKEDTDLLLKEMEKINKSLLKPNHVKDDQYIANEFAFNASALTFCYVKDSSNANIRNKAYGSSMSCKGRTQRRIMIAISALYVWDRAVSYAVCCAGTGLSITFPKQVLCSTYNFKQEKLIPPCNKCFKMYNVEYTPKHEAHNNNEDWEYGNCAENESLSRLLQSDEKVRKEVCVQDKNDKTLMDRQDIENKFKEDYEDQVRKRVKNLLSSRKFKLPEGEWNFFTPSV